MMSDFRGDGGSEIAPKNGTLEKKIGQLISRAVNGCSFGAFDNNSIGLPYSTAVEEVLIIQKNFAKFFGPRMFIRS